MKALSLSRPWPWAIVHGKRIENRSRKDGRMPTICRHRGPLLLHAAKSWDVSALGWMLERGLIDHADHTRLHHRVLHTAGGIFARCTAVGHIEPGGDFSPELVARGLDGTEPDALDLRWWEGGYALVLTDVKATKWVECRGMLGLWTPLDDVLCRLAASGGRDDE